MKRMNFGESKSSGKGFYIALAISLVGVGAAALIAVNRTRDTLNEGTLQAPQSSYTNDASDAAQDVNKSQSSVPVSSEAPAPSSQAPAESAPSSEAPKTNVFTMPLSGNILNKFSGEELVKSKTTGDWFTHDGVDIRANAGTPVKSCADGVVKEIREDGRWGVCVVIDHYNGIEGHYYNLDTTVDVKKDQTLEAGDVIGKVGETAEIEMKEDSHLHFALKQDGKWIDPATLIPALAE